MGSGGHDHWDRDDSHSWPQTYYPNVEELATYYSSKSLRQAASKAAIREALECTKAKEKAKKEKADKIRKLKAELKELEK